MIKNKFLRYVLLFGVGGFVYCGVEVMARGYSHISMLIVGGICFVLIGNLNRRRKDISLVGQMYISSIIITIMELISGIIVNEYLKLGVWDYSRLPYNYRGQICLLFFNIWFYLSLVAIILDDYLRYWMMGEEKPKYKIF